MILHTRTATLADAETVAAANRAMALETENLSLPLDTSLQGVLAVLHDPAKGSYLLAETADGTLAGSLMLTREWSDWRCAWYIWIQSVYVQPSWRGQGVYRQLYQAVLQLAKDTGAPRVRLYAERDNTSARQIYSHLGMNDQHYVMYETEV